MNKNLLILALAATCSFASATVIDFGGLSGPHLSSLGVYGEDGYTVTPTSGDLQQGLSYGNDLPSVVVGPVFSPIAASLDVTRDGGMLFKFNSIDLSPNNGDAGYLFQGYLGGSLVLSQVGTAPAGGFGTIQTDESAIILDTLSITIRPLSGATSVNIDNINVTEAVPEPATMLALGAGLAAVARRRRR